MNNTSAVEVMIQAVSPVSSVSACAITGNNRSAAIETSLFVRLLV
jgi:hypothetical protein